MAKKKVTVEQHRIRPAHLQHFETDKFRQEVEEDTMFAERLRVPPEHFVCRTCKRTMSQELLSTERNDRCGRCNGDGDKATTTNIFAGSYV